MKADLLFVSWNRLAYTQHAFRALCANTAWEHVAKLVLADDASEDGTGEWLGRGTTDALIPAGVPVVRIPGPFGGPVAAVNCYLDKHRSPEAEAVAKIDNDFICCPGWLGELMRLLEESPAVDLLGMRPDIGPPEPCPFPARRAEPAPFVDGNGLWRLRAFGGRRRPQPLRRDSRHGFGAWQLAHPSVAKAWAKPDLPVFTLDCLPFEPWRALAASYAARGWQRGWPNAPYAESAGAYWEWWAGAQERAEVPA